MDALRPALLTINGGSSSVKFAVFAVSDPPARLSSGAIERIGSGGTELVIDGADGESSTRTAVDVADGGAAAGRLGDWLENQAGVKIAAIGHRVVHGGPRLFRPTLVDAALVLELRELIPLDPAHLPMEVALIEAFAIRYPGVPQVACFDTAFHHDLPRLAQLMPIPRELGGQTIRRYGFHGLSYEFLLAELERIAGEEAANGRVILAHLGNGASLAAVRGGRCIDTTMGLTPTGGLVMGTRSGDLDPGLLIHLARSMKLSLDELDALVNHRSGLRGVSQTSSDMRELLKLRATDGRAAEAVSLFCYQAKKWIGAMAAALGGLDTLVFSGGIGANRPEVRAEICEGLGFLGVELDAARNGANDSLISMGSCRVRVMKTDEESVIAGSVLRLLKEQNHISQGDR
jgi:acetate kinase